MARAQQRGPDTMTVLMLVFLVLWLGTGISLLVFYLGQEELKNENRDLQSQMARLITPSERNSIPLVRDLAANKTVVGAMEDARRKTAELATSSEDDPAAVQAKRDQILAAVRSEGIVPDANTYVDMSLFDSLTRLYGAFKTEHQLREDADRQVASLQSEVDQLVASTGEQREAFETRLEEMESELAELETDRNDYRAERDSQIARMEEEFSASRARTDATLTEERRRRAQTQDRLDSLQQRFAAFQRKFGDLLIGPRELATARQPDGTVLTALPGDDLIYIDLGSKDGVVLGLRFSVYQQGEPIPADGQGKAQVEVVDMQQNSSTCRVVRVQGGAVVFEGDHIANPVFDKDRALSFVIVGDFDLDHNGQPDRNGRGTMGAIVQDWGGAVESSIGALTDFVVIGMPPVAPRATTNGDDTPENEEIRAEFERYQNTLEEARTLNVPVMTQEVFLTFLGYKGTAPNS